MRPEGWEETKWKTIPYNAPLISGEQVASVYEAGADAYEEGLKKNGYVTSEALTNAGWPNLGKTGKWYYIPEEE